MDPGLFFRYVIFSKHTIGLLGHLISQSQDRYLHTGQHKHIINAHTNIHVLSGVRTHDLTGDRSQQCLLLPCSRSYRMATVSQLTHSSKCRLSTNK
jgi:hypothetical protein